MGSDRLLRRVILAGLIVLVAGVFNRYALASGHNGIRLPAGGQPFSASEANWSWHGAESIGGTSECRRIDINLTRQELVAWSCGRVFMSTPITSGMPGLRTPIGTFAITWKQRDVYFQSPWPPDSPYYYPPMFVAYAMEFLGGGYFIHTDPDEPASAYGGGSENGSYASHGCVHVPDAAMLGLFSWAATGTTVQIHY
jgi:lipoprotein-anchoring transpeptidase ErfK/SrfK